MSPIYFTRWPVVLAIATRPPVHACIESLRDASHGPLLTHSDAYRCFIGIHYLSTAAISPLREERRLPGYIDTGFGVTSLGDKLGEKKGRKKREKGKKIVKHRDHVHHARKIERSDTTTKISTGFPCFFDDSRLSARSTRCVLFQSLWQHRLGRSDDDYPSFRLDDPRFRLVQGVFFFFETEGFS